MHCSKEILQNHLNVFFFQPETLHFAPPLVSFCAHSPDVRPDHLESLIHIKVGAAPVGEALIKQFKKKAPNVHFREGATFLVLNKF